MFNTKQEIDDHVEKCTRNLNSDVERNLRGLAFAKMYYKIGEYEQALRYVTVYLSTRPYAAEGQNILGKIREKLGKPTQALEAYRLSLELDCKQNSLVLKICELMAKEQHHFDAASARYYCEKARSIDPNNPVIFQLKERLVAAASKNPNDVTDLLLKELESRPLDADIRVRLLHHLVQNNRARDAYTHAYDIEQKHIDLYLNHFNWCAAVVDVLGAYRNAQNALSWEFWMMYVSAWDRYVSLSLNDRTKELEHGSLVLQLDQAMHLAFDKLSACPHKQLVQEFIKHYTGQICWHLLTLMYKQARKALIKYREAGQMGVPLLFAAYSFKPADLRGLWLEQATHSSRLQIQRWHREGAYRCAQAGHMLTSLAHDRKNTILERGTHGVIGAWREKTFKFLFLSREQHNKAASSYFILSTQLLDVPVRLPELDDLVSYTKTAQLVHPDSLHHHIWLGLSGKLSDYELAVFSGLQYTVKTFTNCAAETLNVLDIQSFIYAATLCAQSQQDEEKNSIYYNADKPPVLPIACTEALGTANQDSWLLCAYKVFTNHPTQDLTDVRMTLIRGIETVRCVGNHGLDAKLLVQLATTFTDRASKVAKQSEIEANDARAELYWRAALYLLEKHKKHEHVSQLKKRMFEHKAKYLSQDQILQAINDGKLFMGRQAMKKKDYEAAMNYFKGITDPYASFYLAQMYKMMAEKETNLKSENVTSEMRSQNIILLTKARNSFYVTSDRLRMPGVDPKHPLCEVLFTEIEKIDRLLARIDPDNNRNECDGMSDDNVSSIESDMNYTMSRLETSYHGTHMTPFRNERNEHSRREVREARPSPERLDAQIRQLAASKDMALNKVLEQNKIVLDTQKVISEELRCFRETVSDLTSTINDLKALKIIAEDVKDIKKRVDDLDNMRNVNDMVYELKREIAELKKDAAEKNAAASSKNKQSQLSEEDLYVFDDDYSADLTNITNISNAHANLSASLYQNQRINQVNQSVQSLGYPASPAMYGYPLYNPYQGMAGMNLPQVPGVGGLPGYAQHATDPAAAHLAADYRAMNLLQGYNQLAATGMQAVSLAQGAHLAGSPSFMSGITSITQFPQYSQTNLFGNSSTQTTTSATALSQPPQQLSFGPVSTHSSQTLAPIVTTTSTSVASTHTSKPAPVNVVITSSDPLPKNVTTQAQILSVTIPPEHLKGNKVHNYQITLPSSVSSLANAPSVLSQAPIVVSTQSLLSSVSAPVYSALVESSPKPINNSSSALGLQIEKSLNNSFNRTVNDSEGDVSRDDEHDPCPDFKPIIPLPDEVPVTTGEENEQILFKERSKLFKYVDKEWKERGIGELKILQHNVTSKVRILMRRDQVYKICANHYLQEDMKLTMLPKNQKAYFWAAYDFSDGSVVTETFAAQFKTPELAKKFADCFNSSKMIKSITAVTFESPTSSFGASLPTKSTSSVSFSSGTSLGNMATTSDSESSMLTPTRVQARMGGSSMLNSTSTTNQPSNLGGFKFTSPPTFKPQAEEAKTLLLSTVKSDPPKSAASLFAAFSFSSTGTTSGTTPASTPFSSFTFGSVPATQTTASSLFGGLGTISSPATSATTITPVKTTCIESKSPAKKQEDDSDDFVPTAEFKPVVPLPDIVEVKTGEEDSEILFENKAKLLRYDSNAKEWKERGIGQMKLLKGSNIVRLVMRREQVHKVCCNHQVLKQMKFTKMAKSQNAVTWCAKDFSEGVLSTEMLAIKFKTEELAIKFLHIIQKSQEEMDDSNYIGGPASDIEKASDKRSTKSSLQQSLQQGFGDSFKPKIGDWECKNCLVMNQAKVSRCVACEAPKDDAIGKTAVNNSSFCFGIKPPANASKASYSFGGANTVSSVSPAGFGNQFKPKQGSWECKECYTRNDENKVKCASCETSRIPASASTSTNSSSSLLKGVDLSTGGLSFTFGFPTSVVSSTDTTDTSEVSSTTSAPSSGFGNQLQPKQGSRECQECYTRNDGDTLCCLSCEAPKDSIIPHKSTPDSTRNTLKSVDLSTGGQTFSFGIPSNTKAGTPAKEKSTFSFAALGSDPAKTGFSFSLPNTPKVDKPVDGADKVEEVFGSPRKTGFEFTPRSPRRQSGGQQLDDEGGDDSYYEEEEANVTFKPVIPLPDKVTVVTGEEDEDVVYCHRAKLYKHATGEWKERGIGDLKILFQKEQRKLRVLMRREQVHKICLNHILTSDVSYTKKDEKSWLFAVADFSEGEIEHCSFCLRFKSSEIAEEFMKAINDALKRIAVDGEAIENGSDSDVEFVSETQVTPEEQEEAKRLFLPPKFMAYRQMEDCKCEQCSKEDAEARGEKTLQKSLFGNTSTQNIFGSTKTTFSFARFASPAANSELSCPGKEESVKDLLLKPSLLGTGAGFTCGTPSSPTATTTPPPSTASKEPPKTSIFGGFGSDTSTATTGGSIFGHTTGQTIAFSGGNIFEQAAQNPVSGGNIFGSGTAIAASTFSFASIAKQAETKNEGKTNDKAASCGNAGFLFGETKETASMPSFGSLAAQKAVLGGSQSNMSFVSLAANAENMPFGKSEASTENPFANLGAGAPVFGASKPNISKTEDEGEAGAGNAEHDPHYDPIIPLPDEVVVKTGEEDEQVLFSERGKLYRFTNKEWKERGVGNIKVLYHPGNNTYRLLLRREAVHKVVLNQRITADLEMITFKLSANAWTWAGMNFGEEGYELEKLAVRFKCESFSQAFSDAVQKAIAAVKVSSAAKALNNVAASPVVENVSDVEEEEGEDEEDDEDYDEGDDERTIMYSCDCALYEVIDTKWVPVTQHGLVEIVYDREMEVTRVIVTNDAGITESNTLIAMNNAIDRQPEDYGCDLVWRAVEYADDKYEWRSLKLILENETEADRFMMSYEEGKSFAEQANTIDKIPTFEDFGYES